MQSEGHQFVSRLKMKVLVIATICLLVGGALGGSCEWGDKTYQDGESWTEGPCVKCRCRASHVGCVSGACAPAPCVDADYESSCCGTCPNGPNCMIGGEVVEFGRTVTKPHGDHCTVTCECNRRGQTSCSLMCDPQRSARGLDSNSLMEEFKRISKR